jgi:hypothetical protein
MPDLTGAWAKLDRADEHLATLDSSLSVWRNSNSRPISGRPNTDNTEHRFYVSLDVQPPLVRWGILIGDSVHNLRSALDHPAWQLAGDAASRTTEFPILSARPIISGLDAAARSRKSRESQQSSSGHFSRRFSGGRTPMESRTTHYGSFTSSTEKTNIRL